MTINNIIIYLLAQIALFLPAFLISLSFHEFFHALTATLLGDPTPKKYGRLTLNPIAHIDIFGLIFLLIFRFGWAKPVPFDANNFKHPKLYSIITALAGPMANFILAIITFYLIKYLPLEIFSPVVSKTIMQIISATAYVNLMLGVFNLLPIPPLDGSHVLTVLLINKYPNVIIWFYRYSIFILLLLFCFPQTQMFFLYLIKKTEYILKYFVI
jgi:Zn-dependent protease